VFRRSPLTCGYAIKLSKSGQVGQDGMAVAAVARAFGVAWDTVMRAVVDEAGDRFELDGIYTLQNRPCLALGVDEKVMNRASRGRRRRYVTVLVNLATGRPIDIVPGRSKRVLTAWLAAQTPTWRAGVKIVALDPAAPYRAALTDPDVGLHQATLVVDRFHIAKLANAAVDDARRRVQQETLGHRGRAGDPLYGIRRLLLMAGHRLDERGAARLDTALAAGDPYDEVGCAWAAAQLLAAVYDASDPTSSPPASRSSGSSTGPPRSTSPRSPGSPAPWTAGATKCSPTSAPDGPRPDRSKPSTARSSRSTASPAGSGTSPTTAPGCCSRPP
jgi:hypothetical protein